MVGDLVIQSRVLRFISLPRPLINTVRSSSGIDKISNGSIIPAVVFSNFKYKSEWHDFQWINACFEREIQSRKKQERWRAGLSVDRTWWIAQRGKKTERVDPGLNEQENKRPQN